MNHFPQFLPITADHTRNADSTSKTVYIDTSPYPEVTGEHDPETVAMLKEDYAGQKGELTAITQYVFQMGQIEDNQALSNALLQIAIVEMMHLDMLGDAIVALGGSPSFDDGNNYWSAANDNYAMDYEEMIRADIIAESTAIASYQKHAEMTKNPSVKALLNRIIKDERLHLKFFTELLLK